MHIIGFFGQLSSLTLYTLSFYFFFSIVTQESFHKDGTEGEEGSPCPLKVEAKAKASKVKKVVLKDIPQSTKKRSTVAYCPKTQDTTFPRSAQISLKDHSQKRNKLDPYVIIIKFPLTTESVMKNIEDNNTLVFIVEVKANTHKIKQVVQEAL